MTGNPSYEQPYGWVIVFVSTIGLVLGFGANSSVTILIQPLGDEFGWSRGDVSFAYTMIAVGAACGGLFWGRLSDRHGPRWIAVQGWLILSGSLMLVSLQDQLIGIYLLFGMIGFFGFAGLFTPLLALVGKWFDRRAGLALGITTAGGAVGQAVVPFWAQILVAESGWREAFVYLGVGYLVILGPLVFLLKLPDTDSASATGAKAAQTNWRATEKITLSWICFASLFCCICMAVPLMHLVPLCIDLGFSGTQATGALTTLMVVGVFGRVVFGYMADRLGGLRSYFVASFIQTSLVYGFVMLDQLQSIYFLAAMFGFGFSGVMTCVIISAKEAVPPSKMGFAVGCATGMAWVGMGLGGYLGGYYFDLTGNYSASYGGAALAGGANLLVVLALILYLRHRKTSISTQTDCDIHQFGAPMVIGNGDQVRTFNRAANKWTGDKRKGAAITVAHSGKAWHLGIKNEILVPQ